MLRLVKDGRALAYTAVAQAPTVTLPRLKALTTGSNPTFLDAVLNIAEDSSTSAFLEHTDSWLRQLVQPGPGQKRVVFAGDDTWLRIFPSHWFTWSEGVSSFFVAVSAAPWTSLSVLDTGCLIGYRHCRHECHAASGPSVRC